MVRRTGAGLVSGWVCALAVASSLLCQEAPPKTVRLPDGTAVRLYLKDDLDSKKSKEDDPIRFEVREDVMVGNVVVIPAGTMAQGHITRVSHRGMAGRSGKLGFSVDYVTAPDGAKIPLAASPNLKGGEDGRVTAAATAAYGPAALLRRGWNADIRKGTMLNAYVDGDHEIGMANLTVHPSYGTSTQSAAPAADTTPALKHRPDPPPESRQASPSQTEQRTAVLVKSKPDGADITVDGKYVGSTPSTLKLASGDHSISIRKTGYKTWERVISVSAGGDITVDATLELSL